MDAIIAYDDHLTGETMLLKIRNALYVESLESNLIPPFVMRLAGIQVNECPKFLSKHPTIQDHSLFFKSEDIRILLQLKNTISYFPTRLPSQSELQVYNTPDILTLSLSPESPNWNPHNSSYSTQEASMMDSRGDIIQRKDRTFLISDVVAHVLEPALLCNALIDRRNATSNITSNIQRVSCVMENGLTAFNSKYKRTFSISVVSSRGAGSDLTPERLAKVFDVPIEVALQTMRFTNRDVPRNTKDISLNVRNNQDDQLLRYGRLQYSLYTDTSFAVATRGKKAKSGKSGVSIRGNTSFKFLEQTLDGLVFILW